MSNLIRVILAICFLQSANYAFADDDIDLNASLTGVWSGLDDSRCYVRQYEKNRQQAVSMFCENPADQSSYVFTGIRTDSENNRILDGTLTFVPKGSRTLRSSARFSIGTLTIRGKTPSDAITKKALRPTLTSGSRAMAMPFIRPLTFPIESEDQEMITRSSFGVWSDQSPAPGGSEDLTGVWYGNDGGIYYVTQRGPFISWFGEHPNGAWSNVADGARIETRIALNWADVPKGRILGSGELGLRVDGPNRLIRTSRSGGFGGSEWIRNSDERWVQPDPIGRTDDHRLRQAQGSLCPFDETRSPGEGDREFGGNGPRMTVRIDLSIEPRMRRSVRATVNFTATETGGDTSTVSGTWTRTLYVAPENRTIAEILSDTSTSFDFVSAHSAGLEVGMGGDTIGADRYGIWSFEPIGMQAQPASEAVSRLFYVGDTGGSDISSDDNCTRETRLQFIEFNPMRIRLD